MIPIFGVLSIQQLPALPVLVFLLGGMIVTWVYWPTCPRPALLAGLALVILGVTTVVGAYFHVLLLRLGHSQNWSKSDFSLYSLEAATIVNAVRVVGYVLLLAAAFVGRRAAHVPGLGSGQLTPPPAPRIL